MLKVLYVCYFLSLSSLVLVSFSLHRLVCFIQCDNEIKTDRATSQAVALSP